MRLLSLLFTATLIAAPAGAQQTSTSSAGDAGGEHGAATLPVSLAKIREALSTTSLLSLSTVDERPTFRVQVRERQRLDELLATLDFKAGPVPAGGVYMSEQNRIMFPSVDNPLRQPLAAFNQPELLTILVENLVRSYLGGKAVSAISRTERAGAEAAARDEVRSAIAQYCGSQPGAGAGIQICDTPVR
jgi:hypothetical protein